MDCVAEDAQWTLTKVEFAADLPPDGIILWPNCSIDAWALHDPSVALASNGSVRVGYQATDLSGGVTTLDPTKPACVAGKDMTLSRMAMLPAVSAGAGDSGSPATGNGGAAAGSGSAGSGGAAVTPAAGSGSAGSGGVAGAPAAGSGGNAGAGSSAVPGGTKLVAVTTDAQAEAICELAGLPSAGARPSCRCQLQARGAHSALRIVQSGWSDCPWRDNVGQYGQSMADWASAVGSSA